MEQKEALEELSLLYDAIEMQSAMNCAKNKDYKFPKHLEALGMAITALKKRPAYLRLIKKYQTRDKNQSEELHRLLTQNEKLKKFKTYFDELYGTGLETNGWHKNGETEPFDSFYESALEYMEGEANEQMD